MSQLVAFAVSVFVSLCIATAAGYGVASHHVRNQMPPTGDISPQGVSGGGPVGIGPVGIPTPPSTAQH